VTPSHVIMYREVSPTHVWHVTVQPVCTCGWEGREHDMFLSADEEGNAHLKRYERFPRLVTPD